MNSKDFRRYVDKMGDYGGWFWAHNLFGAIDAFQKNEKVEGNLFEIGTYDGKSAILMGIMRRSSEVLDVCDPFEDKEETSHSRGSFQHFIFNFKNFFGNTERLNVHRKLSEHLFVRDLNPSYRFIHIDGSHSAHDVKLDLKLATKLLNPLGAIFIDDYFNPKKPGVSEGTLEFLFKKRSLSPFVIGYNKIGFCNPLIHEKYLDYMVKGKGEYISLARKNSISEIVNFLNYKVGVLPGG